MTQGSRPIVPLILCLVVVAAAFLPLGSIGMFPLKLDNSWISPADLKIPMWVVPVLAGFVALFLLLRTSGLWTPPRALCPLLAGAATAVSAMMAIVLIGSEEGKIGSGSIALLAATTALLVSTLRDRSARRADVAAA
jgi:hypothetical protein